MLIIYSYFSRRMVEIKEIRVLEMTTFGFSLEGGEVNMTQDGQSLTAAEGHVIYASREGDAGSIENKGNTVTQEAELEVAAVPKIDPGLSFT